MVFDLYLGHLLHICNHLIIALCLFAQPGKKRLAMNGISHVGPKIRVAWAGLNLPFTLQSDGSVSKFFSRDGV